MTGKSEWSRATRDRREALAWRAAAVANSSAAPRPLRPPLTFGEIAERWWDGVERGTIGKRRGAGDPYSETTLRGYGRDLHGVLMPEFGSRLAEEVTELEWQTWIDGLRDAGLSRSRIANLLAVASAIYGWAARPTRRLVPRNPVRHVELPPRDEKPRTRVASVAEAERLLAELRPDDACHASRSTRGCAGRRSNASAGTTSTSRQALADGPEHQERSREPGAACRR